MIHHVYGTSRAGEAMYRPATADEPEAIRTAIGDILFL